MNKDWDKVVVSTDIWKECLRVLKPGAFAFIMCAPRQDVLSRQIVNLQNAGFETGFTSIYWTYASGFPKAANIGKLVDKRNGRNYDYGFRDYLNEKRTEKELTLADINRKLGLSTHGGTFASTVMGNQNKYRSLPSKNYYLKLKSLLDLDDRFDELIERKEAERKIIGKRNDGRYKYNFNPEVHHTMAFGSAGKTDEIGQITKPATDKAKELDGAHAGFQPKPALEVCLCVMKPLSEKSYVDQALANGHGVTWLDSCRIPYQSEQDIEQLKKDTARLKGISMLPPERGWNQNNMVREEYKLDRSGRFPANLLVSDDVLNDGKITKSSGGVTTDTLGKNVYGKFNDMIRNGAGYGDSGSFSRYFDLDRWYETTFPFAIIAKPSKREKNMGLDKWINPETKEPEKLVNVHPTVKPLRLMSYLISLGSRENDVILDPFCGSGTTLIAAKMLKRVSIGIEINEEYVKIAEKRL